MTDIKIDIDPDGESGLILDDSAFEAGALERANAAIARLAEMYVREWAPAAIADMYEALSATHRERNARREGLDRIYRLAHDMKGQGGTFGLPILTELGESMCRLTADRTDASEGDLAVIRAHIDVARAIVAQGGEDDTGHRLMAELRAMIRGHLH